MRAIMARRLATRTQGASDSKQARANNAALPTITSTNGISSRAGQTCENEEPQFKRCKRSVEDDLMCPISLQLPVDPVMADDFRVSRPLDTLRT